MHLFKPPGRTLYCLLQNNENLDKETLRKILKKGEKIRILWDGELAKKTSDSIDTLQSQLINLVIKDYQTVFYRLETAKISEFVFNKPELDWNNYDTDYNIFRIEKPDDKFYPIAKEIILSSNGVKFQKNSQNQTILVDDKERQLAMENSLDAGIQDKNNHIFLIQNIATKEFAGVFILTKAYEEEIQLHYLSGKSKLYPMIKGKKMNVLCSAILEVIKQQFPQTPYLTFSNKDQKTKEVYQGVGFKPDPNRHCKILKINMQEVDMR